MTYAPGAPTDEPAWVRSGTAYFARLLDGLDDGALTGPSLLPGWDRASVVAHVGYNARALIRLSHWARTGVETPMYASTEQRNAEIARGARLGLILRPTDRAEEVVAGDGSGPPVSGSAADLARWLTGRGADGLTSSTGALPDLPRWL